MKETSRAAGCFFHRCQRGCRVSCGKSLRVLGRQLSSAVVLPIHLGNRPAAVPPGQVASDGLLLLLVSPKIRMVQRKFPQRRELTFDAVQPRGTGGREVELHAMGGGPLEHFRLQVRLVVVQDDVQRFPKRVSPPYPLQERKEISPRLVRREHSPQANDAYPLRSAIRACRDLPVANASTGEEDDSRVTAIDLVDQLSFHAIQLLPLVRMELPCSHVVHFGVSTLLGFARFPTWRPFLPSFPGSLSINCPVGAARGYPLAAQRPLLEPILVGSAPISWPNGHFFQNAKLLN